MPHRDVVTCVIVSALGPALLLFFVHNLWQAKKTGVIFGGQRYAPRLVSRTEDPGAFKAAVVTHTVCLLPTAAITINCYVEIFRWVFRNV